MTEQMLGRESSFGPQQAAQVKQAFSLAAGQGKNIKDSEGTVVVMLIEDFEQGEVLSVG